MKFERKPLKRIEGRFEKSLDGIDQFAESVVRELAINYPDVDLIDLEFIFERQLAFQFSKRQLVEFEENED